MKRGRTPGLELRDEVKGCKHVSSMLQVVT